VLGRESAVAGPAADAPRRPSVLLPTFANLSGDADFDYFSYGISEDVATHLGALGIVVIRGPSTDVAGIGGSGAAPSAERAAEYVLTGSVRPGQDRIRVSARVVVADTGAQLWAEAFDEPADVATLLSIQERIAERVAVAIAEPFGPIFRNEALAAAQRPAERLDTYDCVLRYRYYRRNIDERGHGQSLECFRRAVVREPGYADAWAGLALIYLDEHLFEYNAQPEPPDAIVRALEAARKALDIDGGNALANLALTRIRFALGDTAELDRALERVIASRSTTADDFHTIGVLFGAKGDWDRGLPLIDRAVELAGPNPPQLFSLGYALHSLQTGDYDAALRHALRIDTPRWYPAIAIVTVAASLADRPDIARRSAEQLLELRPEFARNARGELAKWHLNDDLTAKFVRGFAEAGLTPP
jgi:TolB-like protein